MQTRKMPINGQIIVIECDIFQTIRDTNIQITKKRGSLCHLLFYFEALFQKVFFRFMNIDDRKKPK